MAGLTELSIHLRAPNLPIQLKWGHRIILVSDIVLEKHDAAIANRIRRRNFRIPKSHLVRCRLIRKISESFEATRGRIGYGAFKKRLSVVLNRFGRTLPSLNQ